MNYSTPGAGVVYFSIWLTGRGTAWSTMGYLPGLLVALYSGCTCLRLGVWICFVSSQSWHLKNEYGATLSYPLPVEVIVNFPILKCFQLFY